jgi:hypothetical protein
MIIARRRGNTTASARAWRAASGRSAPSSVRGLGTEAAADPGAVRVVEGDELGGDEPRGFVDLLGGSGGVLVEVQASQFVQPLQALRALRPDNAEALERLQVAAGVELVTARADLGEQVRVADQSSVVALLRGRARPLCLPGGGLPGIAIDRRAVRLPGQREPAFSESARASIIASAATIASARPAGGEPWLW